MNQLKAAISALLLLGLSWSAGAQVLHVVAAENFYAGVAQAIGGEHVQVDSILNSPNQDPHLFEISPADARRIADAAVVIYNGLGYDTWMTRLLAASGDGDRTVIEVARLTGYRRGDNPHIWYAPHTMPTLARHLAATLARLDPTHKANYARALDDFTHNLAPLGRAIDSVRARYRGTSVTATEPVFGLMAKALGLTMRNVGFQRAIMNDTDPSPSQMIAFERDLRDHQVRAVIYNRQVTNPLITRLLDIARDVGVPTVGVTETAPPDTTYAAWMTDQIEALAAALGAGGK